jgi:hypothetical protein
MRFPGRGADKSLASGFPAQSSAPLSLSLERSRHKKNARQSEGILGRKGLVFLVEGAFRGNERLGVAAGKGTGGSPPLGETLESRRRPLPPSRPREGVGASPVWGGAGGLKESWAASSRKGGLADARCFSALVWSLLGSSTSGYKTLASVQALAMSVPLPESGVGTRVGTRAVLLCDGGGPRVLRTPCVALLAP